ncbi:MAG: transcriptional regulator GcvA [Alphaproteobacteria bacterium]
MTRVLPPFPAVRAFEAAAWSLSFRRAADELHVMESAISHQVKALEAYLGLRLFHRTARGVALTNAGKSYLPEVCEALDRVSNATEALRATRRSGPLTVGMTSAFAARWLYPRLHRFHDAWPAIDVQVFVLSPPFEFPRDEIDLAVWFGRDEWPGLHAARLMDSALFPVCSPRLLRGDRRLTQPDDLRHQTLLHYDFGESWSRWVQAAGVAGLNTARGPRFNDCSLMLQAAIEGHGIALTFSALVTADLTAGRLVRLFDVSLAPVDWYYVVYPEAWGDRPRLAAFRDWLLDEAAAAAKTPTPERHRQPVAAR